MHASTPFRPASPRTALFAILAIFAFLLAAASPLQAQFGSSLAGSVLDSTGAAIPGATVTLVNQDTQATRTVTTGGEGAYRFSSLPPGNYTVTIAATGFTQQKLPALTIAAESPRNLDITLQTGGEVQTVTVNSDTVPLLQTGDASIGSTITDEQVERLPIQGGDPYELLRTAPGITGDGARSGTGGAVFLPNGGGPGGSNSGIFQTENQVQISADGQRVADNNFLLDGVSVNSLTHGGSAVVTPNEEAVSQIAVVSTSYDASDGRNTGAQIKTVSRSGTNQIHGGAFFLYDEPGLNAFNKYGGPAPGTLPVKNLNKSRTWAGSAGGPIHKDKIFLFGSFAENKQSLNASTTGYVETPQFRSAIIAQRSGGISERIVADPNSLPRITAILTPSAPCTGFAAGTCQAVTGGVDIGSLTPGGNTQLGVFTGATGGGLDGIPDLQDVQLSVPSHARGNQYNGRADWQATSRDLIAASVFYSKLDSLGTSGTAGSRPQADVPFKPLNSAQTILWIHTFSPTWLNEARINGTRFAENGVKDAGSTVNFGIPFVNIQGYPSPVQFGVNYGTTTPATFAENTYEARDTLTHSFGSHTIRVGIEVRLEQDNDNLNGEQRPLYAMSGLFNFANDAAVYEQVTANTVTGGTPITQRYFRSKDIAAFIQHDWKVTPNLTFNAGLRWELFTPLRNKGFQINYPVLGPPGMELAGAKLAPRDQLWGNQPRNFGPRFGFAYTPAMFHQKMVVRGGYALSYNHLDIALFNNALEDGPGIASFGFCCASNTGSAGVLYAIGSSNSPSSFPVNPATRTGVSANGFPLPSGGGTPSVEVYGADPHLKYPSSNLFSLDIQGQMPYRFVGTVGFAGSNGHHYARLVDQNFLYNSANSPIYAYYQAQTDSVQNYNALNAQLRRSGGKGLTMSLVYTYSKSLDQVSNGDSANANGNQTNPANNATEYGPSDYDTKHRVVGTVLYELPHIHASSALVNALVNGFQINGTYTWHTGYPWTPVTNSLASNPFVTGAATINPTRPLAYYGGAASSCSAQAFTSGSNFRNNTKPNPIPGGAPIPVGGANYFNTTLPTGNIYKPGIGRNSFRGPCYQDVDLSVAKEFGYELGERHTLLRLQMNVFNAFNILQLQPLTNGNANGGANIANQYFGYSQAADSGRTVELDARFRF